MTPPTPQKMIKSKTHENDCIGTNHRVDERFHDPGVLPTDRLARTLWFMSPEEWEQANSGDITWQSAVNRAERRARRYEEGGN